MSRLSLSQILLLIFGAGLMVTSIFLDPILDRWEKFRYPNAVHWQGMRVVPGKTQRFDAVSEDMLVVKDPTQPRSILTLFLRKEDGLTPQALVRELCSRDACRKAAFESGGEHRAAANYLIDGEAMQILLIHLNGSRIWVEYKGPPEAYAEFGKLVNSVAKEIAETSK